MGTYELSLLNHASANTKFSILGFNYATLNEDIKLIDYSEIPRVANTEDEANTVFGLNMKSGQNGWITKGSTNFTTEGNNNVNGTMIIKERIQQELQDWYSTSIILRI